jgi:signal transduction histidine kinase
MKGLGIGLSLVQEIVNLHRGEIQLQSEVGKGTTFSVMLPLAPGKTQ